MKTLLKKLLVPHHLEYLAIDKDFLIQETSLKVQRFGDCPDEVFAGNDVRIPFPELVGTEEILIDIFERRLPNFELKAITRLLGNGSRLYFDIAVLKKVRYALCPMPYALCPMPYAQSYLIFLRKAICISSSSPMTRIIRD